MAVGGPPVGAGETTAQGDLPTDRREPGEEVTVGGPSDERLVEELVAEGEVPEGGPPAVRGRS